MKTLIETYKKNGYLHHACLLKSIDGDILARLKGFLESELNFSTVGNPDFWCGEYNTFGINDGREIIQLQSRTSTVGNIKIFVISANFFTVEAQNSLLKMFEEPTSGTHFFIITQNTETLLPTLRSRLFVPEMDTAYGQSFVSGVDVEEFLKNKQAGRIKLLKNIIETKDKNLAISFLNELESVLYKKFQGLILKSNSAFVFEEILNSKKYLNGRAPSVKMILENISLVV